MSTLHTDGVMIDYRQTWGLVQRGLEACFTTIAYSRRGQLRTTRVRRAERSVR
jgi:hypothetical protein